MAKKRNSGRRKPRPPAPETPVAGPLPLVKMRLGRLPCLGETWLAECRQLPDNVLPEGEMRPWFALVASETTGLIHASEVLELEPSADELWDVVARAMQQSAASSSQRPAVLRVRRAPVWEELRPHFEEIRIHLEEAEPQPMMDQIFAEFLHHLGGPPRPQAVPILKVPGMGVAEAVSFYEAAAHYYRQAPWTMIDQEGAIEIRCPQLLGGPWYAVIMGESGVTYGLAVYEDVDWLRRIWTEEVPPEEQAAETVATALTYGRKSDMMKEDLAAIKQHHWPVAGAKAYPEAYRTERGMMMRTPTAAEFRVLDACLRAVPAFADQRLQDDFAPAEITVASPTGPLNLTLAWVLI